MRGIRVFIASALLLGSAFDARSQPPAGQPPAGPLPVQQPTGTPPPGGGQQRRAVQVMTLTSTAWPDGSVIPKKYTQAGEQVSPPLTWSDVPENTGQLCIDRARSRRIGGHRNR